MKVARNRTKNAVLLSLIGACVASGGIALLIQSWLEPFNFLIILTGLAVNAAAMFYRRRLEASAGTSLPLGKNGCTGHSGSFWHFYFFTY